MSAHRARRRTPDGSFALATSEKAWLEEALALAVTLAREPGRHAGPRRFAGRDAWWKADRLAPRSALRHGLRRVLLVGPAPRLREFANLRWLRERLFRAAEPLAAGVRLEHGLPREQFLVTAKVRAEPFAPWMASARPSERAGLLSELAREVARLHAVHFVHRDLFPRNLLVTEPEAGRRLVFLDAWAGGPGPQLRGPAYDLGTLFLEGAQDWAPAEQALLLETYLDEARALGLAVEPKRFLARVARERERLVDRLEREPARLRGRQLPSRGWRAPHATLR